MADSQQLKPLFDKAIEELKEMLNDGTVTDKVFISKVMQIVIAYQKSRGLEFNEKKFNASIAKLLNPEDMNQFKNSLQQSGVVS